MSSTPLNFPVQLTVGVVIFEVGLLLLLLDFYIDFICKMAVEAISLAPRCIDLLCG